MFFYLYWIDEHQRHIGKLGFENEPYIVYSERNQDFIDYINKINKPCQYGIIDSGYYIIDDADIKVQKTNSINTTINKMYLKGE